jgi:anti-sigma B factor antagonist
MSNPKILIDKRGTLSDIAVVHVYGALDTVGAYTFQEKIKTLLETGVYKYILDFEHLEYISSAGIGVFFSMDPELQKHHGGIVFIHVPEKIYRLLEMIGLTAVFKIKDTLENAIKEFETDEQ